VVGRSPTCDIVLARSVGVSRIHARLSVTPAGVVVEDLHSRNGTFVDGKSLREPRLLHPKDLVRVGSSLLRVAGRDESRPEDQWAERTARIDRQGRQQPPTARQLDALQRLTVRAATVRRFDEAERLTR